jgi:hypothetical protein
MTDSPTEALPPTPAEPTPTERRALPGNVTAAAVILLVFGTLAAFGAALSLLWSLFVMNRMGMGFTPMMFDRRPGFMDFGGAFDGPMGFGFSGLLFVVLGLAIGAAVAGGHIAAGWAILQRITWGRILGMVVAGAALAVLAIGVLGTLVWVAALPDFGDFARVPEWWSQWIRSLITAGVGFGVVVSLVVGAAYAYVLVILARAGDVLG